MLQEVIEVHFTPALFRNGGVIGDRIRLVAGEMPEHQWEAFTQAVEALCPGKCPYLHLSHMMAETIVLAAKAQR